MQPFKTQPLKNDKDKALLNLRATLGQAINKRDRAGAKKAVQAYMDDLGVKNMTTWEWLKYGAIGVVTLRGWDPKGVMTQVLQETLINQTKENVEWLAEVLGIDKKELEFKGTMKAPPVPPKPYKKDDNDDNPGPSGSTMKV